MSCDKSRQLLQKTTSLCRLVSSYLQGSMLLEWGPCSNSLSFCYILKTAIVYLKKRFVFCVLKRPLKYTSIQVNDMSLHCIVASCCVHASKTKGWMCGSWLTFTTLGSWAPMSNPSIDQEHNETINLTSLFLSTHCKWPLQT